MACPRVTTIKEDCGITDCNHVVILGKNERAWIPILGFFDVIGFYRRQAIE